METLSRDYVNYSCDWLLQYVASLSNLVKYKVNMIIISVEVRQFD